VKNKKDGSIFPIYAKMNELFAKALWCGLLALSLQYLYVGWRLRSERGYADFGLLLLLACGVFWPVAGIPAPGSGFRAEGWMRISHWAALASLPILAVYLSRTGLPPPRRWASLRGGERLRGYLLLLGCGVLGAGALADAARLPGPCYAFLGFAGFAAAANGALIARFLEIHEKNRATLDRLASAYALLQENAGLRDLGASAAMISHEIRNYVSTLKGNALLMGRIEAFLAACENLGVRPRLASGKGQGRMAAAHGGAPSRDLPPGPISEEALLILLAGSP
jgi:hypothetical protein